jgi:hypothetical protein
MFVIGAIVGTAVVCLALGFDVSTTLGSEVSTPMLDRIPILPEAPPSTLLSPPIELSLFPFDADTAIAMTHVATSTTENPMMNLNCALGMELNLLIARLVNELALPKPPLLLP